MPSYEQIRLIGGPCDGETHMWDGGDWFVYRRLYSREQHIYQCERDANGYRTDRFVYQGEQ